MDILGVRQEDTDVEQTRAVNDQTRKEARWSGAIWVSLHGLFVAHYIGMDHRILSHIVFLFALRVLPLALIQFLQCYAFILLAPGRRQRLPNAPNDTFYHRGHQTALQHDVEPRVEPVASTGESDLHLLEVKKEA